MFDGSVSIIENEGDSKRSNDRPGAGPVVPSVPQIMVTARRPS